MGDVDVGRRVILCRACGAFVVPPASVKWDDVYVCRACGVTQTVRDRRMPPPARPFLDDDDDDDDDYDEQD